jgi:phospholipase C
MRPFLSIATSLSLLMSLTVNPVMATEPVTPPAATTPIQHIVVIFGENISFDHYFGTYPTAANPPGQPRFTAAAGTPTVNGTPGTSNYVNGLTTSLLTNNPNFTNTAGNGTGAANPFRLNRSQALTADMSHSDGPEQASFDAQSGTYKMDLFPSKTGSAGGAPNYPLVAVPAAVGTKGLVMGYFDGNTATGLWNYAQYFALNDNSYNSQFGPSTPGALNLISGNTNAISSSANGPSSNEVADGQGGFTQIGDADPLGDVCSSTTSFTTNLAGKTVGDLLNTAGLTWGWFQGGFDLTVTNPNGTTSCQRSTVSPTTGATVADYVQHHQPFQYYASTQNLTHARPSSIAAIGTTDAAKHQYDTHDFFDSLNAGNLAAVSFLKAPAYQDAHPGNSNPLDEQAFVVNVVNTLAASPFWSSTAVIIAYDDSDGWYDHQPGPGIINGSFTSTDVLTAAGACGIPGTTPQLAGPNSGGLPVNGRCSPGVRTPLQVISPWAKANYVDHTFTIQTSIMRFIEDNWSLGQVGGGSFDAIVGTTVNGVAVGKINNMFNFTPTVPPNTTTPLLSTITGEVTSTISVP